ncbi:MAG TPA: STAS domain-containing protein [Candidatus Sulfotelmatobacter sp.]|jgi:anti-sigma B factor antagonist|nr:STAS domain-containing protein [Candidatus Sulfotelmatobacter sp.]
MWIVTSPRPGIVHLEFDGGDALDTANAAEAKTSALAAISGAKQAAVDLAPVEFIDSSGLSVLVAIYKSARARGARLRFHGVRPGVRAVLEIIRLDRIFEITDDAVEARG